jgi:hypothetical protein
MSLWRDSTQGLRRDPGRLRKDSRKSGPSLNPEGTLGFSRPRARPGSENGVESTILNASLVFTHILRLSRQRFGNRRCLLPLPDARPRCQNCHPRKRGATTLTDTGAARPSKWARAVFLSAACQEETFPPLALPCSAETHVPGG